MNKIHSIKIYNDKGVERGGLPALQRELSPWNTSFLSSQDLLNIPWEKDTSLFIMPGGRDVPYHAALKGAGNQKIRRFVEDGGTFLGICAGAYYGCKEVEFDPGMNLEVRGSRELSFFPGNACGPIFGPGSFHYHSEKGAKAALISHGCEKETLRCYYNGGCYFAETERYAHVNVISRYLEIANHPAAIIEMPIGKGKVILSGVHFEIGTTHPPKNLTEEMLQDLRPYEEQRKFLLQDLLRTCSISSDHRY